MVDTAVRPGEYQPLARPGLRRLGTVQLPVHHGVLVILERHRRIAVGKLLQQRTGCRRRGRHQGADPVEITEKLTQRRDTRVLAGAWPQTQPARHPGQLIRGDVSVNGAADTRRRTERRRKHLPQRVGNRESPVLRRPDQRRAPQIRKNARELILGCALAGTLAGIKEPGERGGTGRDPEREDGLDHLMMVTAKRLQAAEDTFSGLQPVG